MQLAAYDCHADGVLVPGVVLLDILARALAVLG